MLSILTATGARPEAFDRCQQYMAAQDYTGPVRWVIVDDGPESQDIDFKRANWRIVIVRPEPFWQPGQNTQARNLLAGLEYCTDQIVIVEDDDEYAPWWLSQCAEWLALNDLVGEAPTLYRHVNGKERMMTNKTPSLCQTAMRGAAVQRFRDVLTTGDKLIDARLWKSGGKVYPYQRGVIGIKGLPGRPGVGIGHNPEAYR